MNVLLMALEDHTHPFADELLCRTLDFRLWLGGFGVEEHYLPDPGGGEGVFGKVEFG